MNDILREWSGDVGTGSTLIHSDLTPLGDGEIRESEVLDVRFVSTLGIDVAADQACIVEIIRLPDGVTPGAVSAPGAVEAGVPAFFSYSQLCCPAVRLRVTNQGGAAMTAFALYLRGGA